MIKFLYNPLISITVNLLVIVPLLFFIGMGKFDKLFVMYRKYLVVIAIIIAIINIIRLYDILGYGKKVEKLDIEHMSNEDMTKCGNVYHISIFDSFPGFSKQILCIKPGECVIWTHSGNEQHTITSTDKVGGTHPDGAFTSGYLKPGDLFGIKFTKLGVYPYYCESRKYMLRGVIVVKDDKTDVKKVVKNNKK